MAVGVICLRMGLPRNGAHPGSGYGVEDSLVRHFTFTGGDRHTAIQDIESEPIRAANERPNGLLEHRNFFCAIKPAHLVGATGTERRRRRGAGLCAATVTTVTVMIVAMRPAMVVFHYGDIATDDGVTQSPWVEPDFIAAEEFATLRRLLEARMSKSGKRELPICPDLIYDRHRPRYRHLSGVTQPGRWRGT